MARLLTFDEIAKITERKPGCIRKWIRTDDKFPKPMSVSEAKTGGRRPYLYHQDQVMAYLDERTKRTTKLKASRLDLQMARQFIYKPWVCTEAEL